MKLPNSTTNKLFYYLYFILSSSQNVRKDGYTLKPIGDKGRSPSRPSTSWAEQKIRQGDNYLGRSEAVPPNISNPLLSQGTDGQARAPPKNTARQDPVTITELPKEIWRDRKTISRGKYWRNPPTTLEPTMKTSEILRNQRTLKNGVDSSRVCVNPTPRVPRTLSRLNHRI